MIRHQRIKPKQGIILISEPSLNDFYFRQSVVLLAEHNEEGSFGLIVNKPISSRIGEIVSEFSDLDFPVYLGGPVKTDTLFFIHTIPGIPNSMKIMDGLFWGGDIRSVNILMHEQRLSDEQIRFFLGYSGWHPNQLDREISENAWVLSQASIHEVIHPHPESLWSDYLKNMGHDYAIWANYPADPTLN